MFTVQVQRVVIQGGDPGAKKNTVDFKGTREVATWLFDDDEAEKLEKTLEAREKEAEEAKAKGGARKGKKRAKPGSGATEEVKAVNLEDLYASSLAILLTELTVTIGTMKAKVDLTIVANPAKPVPPPQMPSPHRVAGREELRGGTRRRPLRRGSI